MVDRLSDHLKDGINDKAMAAYLNYVRKMVPSEPVVHIDDSDVTKPDGYHFEALGTVRDGSKRTTKKNAFTQRGIMSQRLASLIYPIHPGTGISNPSPSLAFCQRIQKPFFVAARVLIVFILSSSETEIFLSVRPFSRI